MCPTVEAGTHETNQAAPNERGTETDVFCQRSIDHINDKYQNINA